MCLYANGPKIPKKRRKKNREITRFQWYLFESIPQKIYNLNCVEIKRCEIRLHLKFAVN